MNYKHYIIKRQKEKHLTYTERNKIEAYLKVGKNDSSGKLDKL